MRRFLLGALVVFLLSVPLPAAKACLWDSETVAREKQFRSSYKNDYQEPLNADQGVAIGVVGGGLALLAGGTFISYRSAKYYMMPQA
jgi:hypothetical protein